MKHSNSISKKMPTAKEKKEEVKIHLKKLRAELRTIHLAVTEELNFQKLII